MDSYIEGFVDINNIKKGKPDSEIFNKAANILSLKARECLVIEDSENGIKAANNAGMKCIDFNNRNSSFQNLKKADMMIDEYNKQNFSEAINYFNFD